MVRRASMLALLAALLLTAPAGASSGVWISDDADRELLTEDMVSSRAGYSFVLVGRDRGILVGPSGRVSSARWAARAARCPRDADDRACSAWCSAVAPDGIELLGQREGPACSKGSSEVPECVCRRKVAPTEIVTWASCRSSCPVGREGGAAAGTKELAAKTKGREAKEPSPAGTTTRPPVSKAGAAAEKKVQAGASDGAAPSSRYLLYDVRFGVSFAEQLQVFLVMVDVVGRLNKQVSGSCPAGSSDLSCLPWTLVLPPWCSVAKWYAEDVVEGTPWKTLFDGKTIRQWIPAVEFATYVRRAGQASVALAVLPSLQSGRGTFAGWKSKAEACATASQTLPQRGNGKQSLVYSGYCPGDVLAADFRCGVLHEASPSAVVDMVAAAKAGTHSVLVKHVDALGIHSPTGTSSAQFHSVLRAAQPLQDAADAFIVKALGKNLPYLAVHLRQNDFRRLRPSTTPSAEAAAARVNALLRERHLEQAFVHTDAPQSFKDALRARVKEPLYYFAPDDGAVVPDLQGKEDVMLLRILARGAYFIGSVGSSFSQAVRWQRRLGSGDESTEEVFCEGLTAGSAEKRCRA